jgi:hypothetical protein
MFLHYLPGTAAWLRTTTDLVAIVHIVGGVAGVAAGVGALTFRKGERWHRLAGTVFFVSMFTLGSTAAVIGVVLNEVGNVFGGLFVCYLVVTAWMTVKRPEGISGRFEMGATVFAFAVATVVQLGASQAMATHQGGPLLAATIIMGALAVIAGAGDLSVVLRRGIAGAQRIARHLWRMCLAFAMAAGAFVTQPSMFPRPMPILLAAAALPLALLLFWLLQVGFTDRFKSGRVGAALP